MRGEDEKSADQQRRDAIELSLERDLDTRRVGGKVLARRGGCSDNSNLVQAWRSTAVTKVFSYLYEYI